MEKVILMTIIMSTFVPKMLCEGDLESSTVPPVDHATSNPNEKSTDLEKNSFLNAVGNYLSDGKNSKENESKNQVQGYISQPMYPIYPTYSAGGYFYPGVNPNAVAQTNNDVQNTNYFSAVLPVAQTLFEIIRNIFLYFLVRHFVLKVIKVFNLILDIRDVLVTDELSNYLTKAALQAGLKLFAKLGLFVMGGAGLLAIGGIFTTLVCYLTPICTISFNGYDFNKALNKETMRSLMTPEKIASAAALVQDAIGKYQRLQRAVGQ